MFLSVCIYLVSVNAGVRELVCGERKVGVSVVWWVGYDDGGSGSGNG